MARPSLRKGLVKCNTSSCSADSACGWLAKSIVGVCPSTGKTFLSWILGLYWLSRRSKKEAIMSIMSFLEGIGIAHWIWVEERSLLHRLHIASHCCILCTQNCPAHPRLEHRLEPTANIPQLSWGARTGSCIAFDQTLLQGGSGRRD